jgi:hypothetical protein
MTFKTSHHSRKSVESIKSYEQFSRSMYSWGCKKYAMKYEYEKYPYEQQYAKQAHFTKEFLSHHWD